MFQEIEFSKEITPTAVIAFCALILSILNLGWTLRRDLRRPRLHVALSISVLGKAGGKEISDSFISVRVTNYGPTANKVGFPELWPSKLRWLTGRSGAPFWVLMPDLDHPATSPKEKRDALLDVGDSLTFAISLTGKCFLRERDFSRFAVRDAFGRLHYAHRKDLDRLRKRFHQEFKWSRMVAMNAQI